MFSKSVKISKVMKTPPMETSLLYEDGQADERTGGELDRHADIMKLIVAFRSFVKASNNRGPELNDGESLDLSSD